MQPVRNIWPHGEKQQATTLASLTALHLREKTSRFHVTCRAGQQGGKRELLILKLALWVLNEALESWAEFSKNGASVRLRIRDALFLKCENVSLC